MEAPNNNQPLQVVAGVSLTLTGGGSALALLVSMPPPRVVGPFVDPPRRSTSLNTTFGELSPALLGQFGANGGTGTYPLSPIVEADIAKGGVEGGPLEGDIAVTRVSLMGIQGFSPVALQENVQHQIAGVPGDEQEGVPFTDAIMEENSQRTVIPPLLLNMMGRLTLKNTSRVLRTQFFCIGTQTKSCVAFLSPPSLELKLPKVRELWKMELNLFAIGRKDNKSLSKYFQRTNTTALEVTSATQEVKASTFSHGLLDGDFLKSLAKKPVSKLNALLARAAKYINIEDAEATKKESYLEKRKEATEEGPFKKSRTDFRDNKASFQSINTLYSPLTHPRSWRE
ncbi:UNVERIFIED_CONTAM: hypothetical protein Sindi_0664800 [Sesamum indicum]